MQGELAVQLREALSRSDVLVRRSHLLIGARRLLDDEHAMLTRCAWCGRISLDGVWADQTEAPRFLYGEFDGRTTHGICGPCVDGLERSGASHPKNIR